MSGDGTYKHRKESDDLQEPQQDDEEGVSQQPRQPRPSTARPGARQRRTTPSSSDPPGAVGGEGSYQQNNEDEYLQRPRQPRPSTARRGSRQRRTTPSSSDPPGAVGGEGSYTKCFSEEEKRVGSQAQMLLEMFIMERMKRETVSPHHRRIVQSAVRQDNYQQKQISSSSSDDYPSDVSTAHRQDNDQQKQTSSASNDDYLEDVSTALRDIGDQLSQDYELNQLIDMVPIQSPREIFMKVCKQMFQDGQFNWGRVVALFYFAYRLIKKAVVKTVDTAIPWMNEIFHWAIDFFLRYVAWWIIQRGGWKMIKEYWGPSRTTLTALGATAIICIIYTWWKQQ